MSHFSPQLGYYFCHLLLFFLLFFAQLIALSIAHSVPFPKSNDGCPSEMMQKCAEPLQQLGISSGKNLVLLLLQLHSPSQIRKSCQAYATALPCFQKLVHRCGIPSQAEILRQMENAHQFLCSPFSGFEQSQLLTHRICIGRILGQMGSGTTKCGGGEAATAGGRNSTSSTAIVLFRCRERCLSGANGMSESAKFACLVSAWLSEQNLCLSEQLRAKCGREAAAFYTKMQRKIFHAHFPVICEQNEDKTKTENGGRRDGENNEWEKKTQKGETNERDGRDSNAVPPAIDTRQTTIFVTPKKRRKTVARLSEFKLKFTGTKRRSSNNSSSTTAGQNENGGSAIEGKAKPSTPTATASYSSTLPPGTSKSVNDTVPVPSSPPSSPFTASSPPFSSPRPPPLPPAAALSSPSSPPSRSLSFSLRSSIIPVAVTPLSLVRTSSSSPLFSNFTSLPPPFANARRTNASSSSSARRNRIIQLLAAQSVPFHFSPMVQQFHKQNYSGNGPTAVGHRPPSSAPQKALPTESLSSFRQSLSFPSQFASFPLSVPVRPSSPSSRPAAASSSSSTAPAPSPPPFYSSVLSPVSSSPSSLSVPHYYSSSSFSSLSDSSSLSSPPFLPPLIPFPSHPSPFSPSSWIARYDQQPHQLQQQQDGLSRLFFFEVLPIDDVIYNP